MLAATQRLRRSNEFAAVIRGGRRAGRGTVVVHLSSFGVEPRGHASPQHGTPACVGGQPAPARAGFVVSKVVGNAVVRNAVRRRLRHLVASRLDRLPAGTMLVVRALPAAATAPSPVLADDLDAALDRAARPARHRPATPRTP